MVGETRGTAVQDPGDAHKYVGRMANVAIHVCLAALATITDSASEDVNRERCARGGDQRQVSQHGSIPHTASATF